MKVYTIIVMDMPELRRRGAVKRWVRKVVKICMPEQLTAVNAQEDWRSMLAFFMELNQAKRAKNRLSDEGFYVYPDIFEAEMSEDKRRVEVGDAVR